MHLDLPLPVWVVIPTYNERENLGPLVDAVRAELSEVAPDHTILIVDDSSPDGTGRLADDLAASDPRVQVLHRPGTTEHHGFHRPVHIALHFHYLSLVAGTARQSPRITKENVTIRIAAAMMISYRHLYSLSTNSG